MAPDALPVAMLETGFSLLVAVVNDRMGAAEPVLLSVIVAGTTVGSFAPSYAPVTES